MKKTKKGLTLVEVLVAITVLSITMFALLSTIVAMRKVVARQEEYVKIKMVCQDIDAYYKNTTMDDLWYKKYFGDDAYVDNNQSKNCYLTADFKPTTDINKAEYIVSFIDNNSNLNLSIKTRAKDRVIVSGLKIPLESKESN